MATEKDFAEPELPTELGRLASLIDEKPESFVSGDKDIQDAALVAAKYIFDLTLRSESHARTHLKDLLDSIGPLQSPQTRARTRSTDETVKRRMPSVNHAILTGTPLSVLFIDGMDEDQIWSQLELKAKNVCETLENAFDAGEVDEQRTLDSSEDEENGEEDGSDSEDLEELKKVEGLNGVDGNGDEDEEASESEGDDEDESGAEDVLEEKVTELRDPSSSEEESEEEGNRFDFDARPSSRHALSRRSRGKMHAGLDDGFFSLDDFNAETEEAEARSVSHGSLSRHSDDEESEGDDEVNYFTAMDAGQQLELGAGEAYYKDFFDPPSKPSRPPKRKAEVSPSKSVKRSKVRFNEQVKVKTIKAKGKGLPLSSVDLWKGDILDGADEDDEDDVENDSEVEKRSRIGSEDDASGSEPHSESDINDLEEGREAVGRLKDDLFADKDEGNTLNSGVSAHEARMEVLRKQIAELEAENIAEKDWVMKGEIASKSRPQNALLEEDLEFERVTKTTPVVTDEVVQDLETRIKARIVEGRFDDVVRKRPVDDKPFLPSQVFELQDTKSKESLAEIYENEYLAGQTGGSTDDRNMRLQKERQGIETQWESICYKLDTLCNAHFTPKRPKATISTVSNVSAISLESPLPTAKAASTVLAPEEVFALSTSNLRSKSELAPAEKRSLRSKERKKRRKQRQLLEKSVDKFARANGAKNIKKQKEEAVKSLVKRGKGITVIGKKSQVLKNGKGGKR